MVPLAFSSCSGLTSYSEVSKPLRANVAAMPGPIVPAPTTATFSVEFSVIVSPQSRRARFVPSPCYRVTFVSMHADAAPDVDCRAVDEGRVVRDEKDDQPADVFRLLETPDRRVTQHEVEVALRECRAGARCLQERWRHINAGDTARTQLGGDSARESQYRALARHVVGEPRRPHPDRVGADIDDLATPLLGHCRDNSFGGEKCAFDVDRKPFPP